LVQLQKENSLKALIESIKGKYPEEIEAGDRETLQEQEYV
jgi:hypothetical protein